MSTTPTTTTTLMTTTAATTTTTTKSYPITGGCEGKENLIGCLKTSTTTTTTTTTTSISEPTLLSDIKKAKPESKSPELIIDQVVNSKPEAADDSINSQDDLVESEPAQTGGGITPNEAVNSESSAEWNSSVMTWASIVAVLTALQ